MPKTKIFTKNALICLAVPAIMLTLLTVSPSTSHVMKDLVSAIGELLAALIKIVILPIKAVFKVIGPIFQAIGPALGGVAAGVIAWNAHADYKDEHPSLLLSALSGLIMMVLIYMTSTPALWSLILIVFACVVYAVDAGQKGNPDHKGVSAPFMTFFLIIAVGISSLVMGFKNFSEYETLKESIVYTPDMTPESISTMDARLEKFVEMRRPNREIVEDVAEALTINTSAQTLTMVHGAASVISCQVVDGKLTVSGWRSESPIIHRECLARMGHL